MHRHGGAVPAAARIALALAGFFFVTTLGAQTIVPIRDDITLPARGTLRIGVRGEFYAADEMRTDSGLVPLASRFDFGGRRVRASASVSLTRMPFTLEYGVLSWLSVGVTVPLVRRQVSVAVDTMAREPGDTATRRIDLAAVSSGTFTHTNVGDVEATLMVGLWQRDAAASGPRGHLAVALTGRFATGQKRPVNNYFDPGSGDGQADVEIAGGGVFGLGRRVALGAVATHVLQQRGVASIVARDSVFPSARVVAGVSRDPGDITTLAVTPRYTLSRFLDFVAGVRFVRKGADASRETFDGATADPAWGLIALPRESFTETRVAVGFDFSSLTSRHGAIGSWPAELTFRYELPVARSGATLPMVRTAVVGGRLHARF